MQKLERHMLTVKMCPFVFLLETMACAISVLAHTACGNADVIQDNTNGFLRDLATPIQLRDALTAILSNRSAFPPLGNAARHTIENRFTFPEMATAYRRLYLDLAARGA